MNKQTSNQAEPNAPLTKNKKQEVMTMTNERTFSKKNETRSNYKMFKAGKRWVFACAAALSMITVSFGGMNTAHAATDISAHRQSLIDNKVVAADLEAPTVNPFTTADTNLTGTSVAGGTLVIKVNRGADQLASVNADGTFSVNIGKQDVDVPIDVYVVTDDGSSPITSITVTEASTQTVEVTSLNSLDSNATAVTGKATPLSTISVSTGGAEIASAKADADGNFSVPISAQKAETVLSVTATLDGKTSTAKTVTVGAATTETVEVTSVTPLDSKATAVTGTATPLSTVSVATGGKELANAKADSNGKFSVPIDAQAAKTVLSVTASLNGATSDAVEVTVSEAPTQVITPPTINDVTEGDAEVSGTGTVGDTVTVTVNSGTALGTSVVNASGDWSVPATNLKSGDVIHAVASLGDVSSVETTKTVAPLATGDILTPTINPLDSTTTTLSGKTTPAATVTAKNGNLLLGTATADAEGNYTMTIQPQAAGATVSVVATLGTESSSIATTTVNDATNSTISFTPMHAGDLSVSGKAPVNTPVRITDKDKNQLGVGIANASGVFTISISRALVAGEAITATSGTGANAKSYTENVTAQTVAAPTITTANPSLVQGTAPAGSTVRIFDAANKEIGVEILDAAATGFEITMNPKLNLGDKITATAELNGIVSAASAAVTVTPAITATVMVQDNTTSVYGTVSSPDVASELVYVQNGDTIVGAGAADENGNFIIGIDGLTAGETLTVHTENLNTGEISKNTDLIVAPATVYTPAAGANTVDGSAITGTEAHLYEFASGHITGNQLGIGIIQSTGAFEITMTGANTLDLAKTYAVVIDNDSTNIVQVAPVASLVANPTYNKTTNTISGTADEGTVVTIQNLSSKTYARVTEVNASKAFSFPLSSAAVNNTEYVLTYTVGGKTETKHFVLSTD